MGQQSTRHDNELKDKGGKTLIELCYNFEVRAIRRYLAKSDASTNHVFAKISKQCFSGQTHKDRLGLFQLFVQFGADVDVFDKSGKAVIHYACLHPGNDCQLLKGVIAAKADVNSRCLQTGSTPLHLCSCYNFNYQTNKKSFDASMVLLNSQADVSLVNHTGDTVLHLLVDNQFSRLGHYLAECVLEKGLDINWKNTKGQTAMHKSHYTRSACDNNHVTFSWDKFLIRNGANPNIRASGDTGQTPIEQHVKNLMYVKHTNSVSQTVTGFSSSLQQLFLLNIKAGLNISNISTKTLVDILQEAVKCQNRHLALALVEAGGMLKDLDVEDLVQAWNHDTMLDFYGIDCFILCLKRLAANVIRTSLQPNALVGIEKLNLPTHLKDYVVLKNYY